MSHHEHNGNVVKVKDEVISVSVKNPQNESLGDICEVMVDKVSGRVAYAVLDSGSFLGMGGKLFALPWNALHYNPNDQCFILNVEKEKLKNAPGFDKNNWPDMANKSWGESVSNYYGAKSYWE